MRRALAVVAPLLLVLVVWLGRKSESEVPVPPIAPSASPAGRDAAGAVAESPGADVKPSDADALRERTGLVLDASDGSPVVGARVEAELSLPDDPIVFPFATNAAGLFFGPHAVRPGPVRLRVRPEGGLPFETEVTVPAGGGAMTIRVP